MDILFLSARYPPDVLGGGEISTRLSAEGLVGAGARVTVLCGGKEDTDEMLNGVRVIRSRQLHPWWGKPLLEESVSRQMAATVTAVIRRFDLHPDITHAQEFRSALALSLLDHPRRFVTIRDYAPICGTTNNMWWDGSSCDGCFWPNVLFRCHRVVEASLPRKPFRVVQYKGNLGFRMRAFRRIPNHVYTSRVLKQKVEERLHPPANVKSHVIPNPVDPAWLEPAPVELPTANAVCAVGRLETTKGTDVLLRALVQVRETVPDIHLHLAGGGEPHRYEALANRLGVRAAVTFHGAMPSAQVRDLIDQSAVVVSPHVWEEPFGRAALEAGARARPLIASDLGGVRETTTSETAILVSPKDSSALAETIAHLLTDRARAVTLGNAARRHVAACFASDALTRQLLGQYETTR